MNNWKKTVTVFVAIAVISISLATFGCGSNSDDASDSGERQIVAVTRDDLMTTISAIGNISMPEQAYLTFGSGGSANDLHTVQEVNVSFGDTVRKGDVLAKIDTASLERAVEQAEANLRTAQINLEQASSETNILKAKATIESAKASLASAENDLSDAQNPYSAVDLAKTQAAVDSARASLASAEDDLSATQGSAIMDAEAAVRDAQVALENTQRSLTIAQKNGAVSITDAQNSLTDAEEAYNDYVFTNIYRLTQLAIAAQKDRLWWDVLKAQENLDIANAQAENSIATAENNVTEAEEALQSAEENLARTEANPTIIQQKQSAVATAQAALDQALEDLAAMQPDSTEIQQKQSQVATARANLAQAEDDLSYIEAGYDIELLQIKVDNAQVALDDALEQVEAATIIAPFDGMVAAVNVSVGDEVTATKEIIHLVNTGVVEVDAAVDEYDVATVEVGQMAMITTDAVPDARLRGQVTAISPISTSQSGVVSYGLAIAVQGAGRAKVKEGMNVTITIISTQAENVLLVSSNAIQRTLEGNVVQVVIGEGQIEQKIVEVGISNGQQTEIISGLMEGEQVLVQQSGSSDLLDLIEQFRQRGGVPPGGGMRIQMGPPS